MSLSAILIGNETLTRECAEIWLSRGHSLAAVVTGDAKLRAWAQGLGIATPAPGRGLADRLPEADWLMSIANLTVLGGAVLARAPLGAVNFHDGPLPEHAGLNAPVWALLAAEPQHAITWHLIEGGVDQGRILEERRFDIAPGETALTLNTRCFEAGLESFPAVVAQLETGLLPKAQASGPHRMHRRDDRPAAMGRIDFSDSAEDIIRQVRALDHGRYWNPLTTAKIDTGSRIINVGSADPATGSGPAGMVLAADDAGLVVACGRGAVRFGRLTCQEKGLPLHPAKIAARTLPIMSADLAADLTAALARIAPDEGRLRQGLRGMMPLPLGAMAAADGAAKWQSVNWGSAPLAGGLPALALATIHALGAKAATLARGGDDTTGLPGYIAPWQPLPVISGESLQDDLDHLQREFAKPATGWPLDMMTRDTTLADLKQPEIAISGAGAVPGSVITLTPDALIFDESRISADRAQSLAARIGWIADQIGAKGLAPTLSAIPALTPAERDQVLNLWNETATEHDRSLMVHTAFEAQVALTPDAPAIAFEAETLSYSELNARANRAAHVLLKMGVGPGVLVGLATSRSLDLVAGALAIQKAGGAYVPMDPAYPAERIALFVEDSACPVIVTQSGLADSLPGNVEKLCLDTDPRLTDAPEGNPVSPVQPSDVAYMIYTSGSTGRPKGVMVEHRNVQNFFTGMDQHLAAKGDAAPGVWLAVTSLSFDISVLELFWTLARGFKVVISSDENRALVSSGQISSAEGMEFSIYYWGNDDGAGAKKYNLLLEGARFADENGFVAVWTPERHFHAFGGPYPNPSVTGAAVAAVTKRIGVRAGSVVAPLHHPARIAEEWAVIDNLTEGRAGLAFASGWHPDDFVLRPENAPPGNKTAMIRAIDQVRALWRGEGVVFPKADGSMFEVKTQPRPVSTELPVWVTTAGNPETWAEAGRLGANVLTHLLGQSIDEVAEKIGIYHGALRAAGHDPARFKVTLMLHTYIAATRDQARQVAEAPMKSYLASAAALVKQYAWAFPAFKKPKGAATAMDIDLAALSDEENAAILDFAFHRYFEDSGLFGTVDDAIARVEGLQAIGVAEVACLIDYGIAPDLVLEGLRPLAEVVRRTTTGGPAADDFSIAAQIHRHKVTHLQCTPSMARMIAMNDEARAALGRVGTMLLGGEALPGALVDDLRGIGVKRLLNVYGPTETTIWSSAEEVGAAEPIQNIGRPLANQQLYVLDDAENPVPPGVEGELWIGGEGVTRGYWQRPDLTDERFKPNPFHPGRMYRTGDLVRWRGDGKIDYVGRADHQVKLRGYRIELGEIEAVLEALPNVTQAVALAREDNPGDLRLVVYTTGTAPEADLRGAVAELPAHMRPAHYVRLDAFPLTPNRKVDRKALPAPNLGAPHLAAPIAAEGLSGTIGPAGPSLPGPIPNSPAADGAAAAEIARIWARVLGLPKVGPRDNFFTLGGHSLLAVQTHREIREALPGVKLSITDIFRFPVLEDLVAHVGVAGAAPVAAVAPRAPAPYLPANASPASAPMAVQAAPASSFDDMMARRRAMRLARRGVDA